MTICTERRFQVWGQTLAALEKSGQGMPILALHGWLDNAASFLPLMALLPNPVVALDFAGHGLSDHRPAEAATHYVDHVRDVLAVADQLGWSGFVLLGHSMGAGVATLFAGCYPERVTQLVLIEGMGPPSTPAADVARTLRRAIDEMQQLPAKQKPVYASLEQAVAARTRGFGGLSAECARLLCERGVEEVPGGLTWRTDARLRLTSSLRLTEDQVEGFIRAIRAPVLLIVAEQGLGGQGQFKHRLDWVENLQLVALPGGHHLHMETPQPVAEAVRRFLDG